MSDARRLLVADDDADTRSLLYELLDGEGYKVTLVSGGIDAIKKLSHETFDLVLSDLQMGDMHGAWVVRNIKRFWPKTPVIIVTGHPEDSLLQEALAEGVAELVTKPFRTEVLLDSVRSALNGVSKS